MQRIRKQAEDCAGLKGMPSTTREGCGTIREMILTEAEMIFTRAERGTGEPTLRGGQAGDIGVCEKDGTQRRRDAKGGSL